MPFHLPLRCRHLSYYQYTAKPLETPINTRLLTNTPHPIDAATTAARPNGRKAKTCLPGARRATALVAKLKLMREEIAQSRVLAMDNRGLNERVGKCQ